MAANVKMLRFISHNGKDKPISKAKEHIKYMVANREIHRNKPELFNSVSDKLNKKEIFKRIEEQPRNGIVLHKFVITLSEDERDRLKIDLKELARDTMSKFEMQTNRRLDWVGAIHDDKGHPHVHIAIRGRDMGGKQVGIFPVHVKELKRIAEREKTRQAERNLSVDKVRDIMKELNQERTDRNDKQQEQQKRDIPIERPSPERFESKNDFAKSLLSTAQAIIKKSQREMERLHRRNHKETEREAERKKGRGMSR